MARRISFSMTVPQFVDGSKKVTRRMGFQTVRVGDEMVAVEKAMGMRRGERQVELGRIVVTDVRRERLADMTDSDCALEGFPELDRLGFIAMFRKAQRCEIHSMVTRIEFRKVVPDANYYILDARSCVGNCALWWGKDSNGYVCDLGDAGLYTLDDASSHRETDIPVHRSIAEARAVRHVRWEPLHAAGVGINQAQRGKRPTVLEPESEGES